MKLKEDEIRSAINNMPRETLVDALALFLAQGNASEQFVSAAVKPDLTNFSQAIHYLRKNYEFAELDKFSTEADLVYIHTGDRKVLLTDRADSILNQERNTNARSSSSDTDDISPDRKENLGSVQQKTDDSGRFSNLDVF